MDINKVTVTCIPPSDFFMKTPPIVIVFLALLLAGLAAVALPALGAAGVTFSGPEQLGRPTATSIALNVVPDAAADVYIQYGTSAKSYAKRTATVEGVAGKPLTVAITSLSGTTTRASSSTVALPKSTTRVSAPLTRQAGSTASMTTCRK